MAESPRSQEAPVRLNDVEALSTLGILLVVFGHSHTVFDPTLLGHRIFRATIDVVYSFHMPLFFYVSGYLLRYSLENRNLGTPEQLGWRSVRAIVTGRFRRLIVPYLFLSSLVFPIKSALDRYTRSDMEFSFSGYAVAMLIPWANPIAYYWFLPTLFLASTLSVLVLARVRLDGSRPLLILALLSACSIWAPLGSNRSWLNVYGVASNLIFLWLGILHRARRNQIDARIDRLRNVPGYLGLAVVLIGGTLTIGFVRPIHLVLAPSGILLCILFAREYADRGWSFLRPLDGHTYRIYLLSWFPQALLEFALPAYASSGMFVTSVAMFVAGVGAPMIASVVISRWLPRLEVVIPR